MTPDEQNSFLWIQMKYGQMCLKAETLSEQVAAVSAENTQLKKQLEEKKSKKK